MSTLIKNLQIKNFKSVRDLSLECDRINIFIGKPNAGKSNILEAISLLGAGYSSIDKFMNGFIRYNTIIQLFSNFNFRNAIEIKVDSITTKLSASEEGGSFRLKVDIFDSMEKLEYQRQNPKFKIPMHSMDIAPNGTVSRKSQNTLSPVKKYDFFPIGEYKEKGLFLHPPHGDNFYLIIRSNPELRMEIQKFLQPNGLELLLDEESQRMAVVQKTTDSLLSFPMHLVPDTFQRYIFHLAAIMSNRNSVLLFEEPESHSYAPYIYELAQHILDDEGGNQYFITTHNPYLLTPILQETREVALFVTWFENYQTHARRLSETEIREMLDYGVDVFLNLDQFIPS